MSSLTSRTNFLFFYLYLYFKRRLILAETEEALRDVVSL